MYLDSHDPRSRDFFAFNLWPGDAGVIETGPMSTPRAAHSATSLPGGSILVAGGFGDSGGAEASAELFDPTTGAFQSTGAMSIGRYTHSDSAARRPGLDGWGL